MIISASRRTDIPAFYSEWLVSRLREGYVLVRNPMNYHQVSRIALWPATVECLVFWTKNPRGIMGRLKEIEHLGYPFYFLFTLTVYDDSIERNVPPLPERIAIFQDLAARIGRDRVIWRYDPILITDRYSANFHREAFAGLAETLAGFTERCIVSFVQMYKKCQRNMRGIPLVLSPVAEQVALVASLRDLASPRDIVLQSCAQGGELGRRLQEAGIAAGKCIDDALIEHITEVPLTAITSRRDKNQRPECGCTLSVDIGAYDCCPHHCLYCYANSNRASVAKNFASHAPDSPLLYGNIDENDRITERKTGPLPHRQQRLF